MKLTPIMPYPANTNTSSSIRIGTRSIKFYAKAAELLDLHEGSAIVFLQDEADAKSIYITKSDSGYKVHRHGQSLMIYCSALVKELKQLLLMDRKEVGVFRLGAPETYSGQIVVPVITIKNWYNGS